MKLPIALAFAAFGALAHGQVSVGVYANRSTFSMGEDVPLGIVIKNTGRADARFTFRSGQFFDIRATNASGEQVWQWSETMRFRMALTPMVLKPGQYRYFTARWNPGSQGVYTLTPMLGPTTTDVPTKSRPVKITISEEGH